jgi:hypothetical protein
MIAFDPVVVVLLGHVCRGGDQVVDHPQVRAGLIGGHLHRCRAVGQRPGEEPASGRGVPLLGQQDVDDDLAVLVNRPIQIPPPAGHLDVRLVHEPAVPDRVPQRAGGRRTAE